MFSDLPSEIKRIIFNMNKIDYTYKSKKETINLEYKLKYYNVMSELTNCFNNYLYEKQLNEFNEIKLDKYILLEGYIRYNGLDWILVNDYGIINNGKINYIPNRRYINMYINVKDKIKLFYS